MIYGFDTTDDAAATASLLLYAIWRSRDRKRFKITPELWGQVERFTKAAAKRAYSLPDFIERLKPRLCCDSLDPRAMRIGASGVIPLLAVGDGAFIEQDAPAEQREFLTALLDQADTKAVLTVLYRETAYAVLLVRDRLERERPIESRFETALSGIGGE